MQSLKLRIWRVLDAADFDGRRKHGQEPDSRLVSVYGEGILNNCN